MSDAPTTPPVPEESSHPRKSGDIPAATPDIGGVMAVLARTLQREHSSEPGTLQAVTTGAVRAVPGAAQAVISLVIRRKMVQAQAATDPSAGRLDELQTELDDGPCLRAVWEQQTVHIPDMATESRWPRFAAAAIQAGVGAMLCFQLFVEGDNLGALNLYGATAGAFTEESETVGLIFATHAAVALVGATTGTPAEHRVGESGHHRPSQRHRDGTLPHRRRPRLRPHHPTLPRTEHQTPHHRHTTHRRRNPTHRTPPAQSTPRSPDPAAAARFVRLPTRAASPGQKLIDPSRMRPL